MRYRDGRRSVCLSSQSGCPLTCTFCATGSMRFGRNLTAGEILDQALHFRRGGQTNHAVFMGMGEPLMNLDAVLEACRRLPALGITHRRTGISTVGWVPGIQRLTDTRMPLRLALSLHAPEDSLRSQIMPVNERYPIAETLAACRAHYARKRRQVFVEYVMLAGVNDRTEQAHMLAGLLDPRIFKVNLIPFNPTDSQYDGSSRAAIRAFRDALAARGFEATVRLTRGRDIDAACGQLAVRANGPAEAAAADPCSARVESLDLGLVLAVDRPPLELHGRRQLVAAGLPLVLDDREPLDLLHPREMRIGLVDRRGNRLSNPLVAGERGDRPVRQRVLLGEGGADVRIQDHQRDVVGTPVADRHRLPDQRVALLMRDSMLAGDMFFPAALMISSFLRSTIFR